MTIVTIQINIRWLKKKSDDIARFYLWREFSNAENVYSDKGPKFRREGGVSGGWAKSPSLWLFFFEAFPIKYFLDQKILARLKNM